MSTKNLIITARPKGGFRRAGFHFSEKPTVIPVDQLTPSQIAGLKEEKSLIVIEHEGDYDPESGATVPATVSKQIAERDETIHALGEENAQLKADLEAAKKELAAAQDALAKATAPAAESAPAPAKSKAK